MSTTEAVVAFTVAAAILTITPGLDTALVLRTAAVEGRRRGMLAGIGISCGVLVWGAASSIGLSALLAASRTAYDILRFAGAAYLMYLGLRLLVARWFRKPAGDAELPSVQSAASAPAWFARGFLTNILNPKVGIFYVSFLPQFIPTGVNVLAFGVLLAFIHSVLGVIWFLILTRAADSLSRWLRRRRVASTIDTLTGGMFMAFGVKLALSKR